MKEEILKELIKEARVMDLQSRSKLRDSQVSKSKYSQALKQHLKEQIS